jgi:hypothetical protein
MDVLKFNQAGDLERLEEMIRILASRAGPAGPQGPSGTVPIFANIAALTASSIVGLSTGSMSVVTSVGALWYLDTASALTTDGITIVATSGAGRWLRGPTLNPEAALAVLAWGVDPVAGNDEAAGSVAAPFKHKAEIARRLGTWGPIYGQAGLVNVTVKYISADTGSTDPGLFAPILLAGSSFTEFAALPTSSFTGTLLVVTAKAAGNPLQSTVTTTTGAMAVGLFLVNSDRGNSCCFVESNNAGNWNLSQPMSAYAGGGAYPFQAENNNWANGDHITGYALLQVNIPLVGGEQAEGGASNAGGHIVWNLDCFAPDANADTMQVQGGAGTSIAECRIGRSIYWTGKPAGGNRVLNNCDCYGTTQEFAPLGNMSLNAGILRGTVTVQTSVSTGSDMILVGNATFRDGSFFGSVFVDNKTVTTTGFVTNSNPISGTYIINVQGTLLYGATAVARFTGTPTLKLQTKTTAYSITAGVVSSPFTITPAAIDAASGPAGFGGTAANFAGASITNGNQN